MDTERLSLAVELGTGAIITRLAEGERRRGAWLSRFVRAMADGESVGAGMDYEMLRLTVQGLAATVKMLEAKVARLEAGQ